MEPTEYSIHGVPIRVVTGSVRVREHMQLLLGGFGVAPSPLAPAPLDVRLEEHASPASLPEDARARRDSLRRYGRMLAGPASLLGYELFTLGRRLLADFFDRGFVSIDYEHGQADAHCYPATVTMPGMLTFLCRFTVTELLKRRGLHAVHASAVERKGRGILFAGRSGRGKTTCCIALVRAGFRFLSDDHPLLQERGFQLTLLPFATRFQVTSSTIELVPELRTGRAWVHNGIWKNNFALDEFYGTPPGVPATPGLILFPQIVAAERSHLVPISRSVALQELLPSAIMMADRQITEQQLSVFNRLAAQADAYRLFLGRDVLELPRLVAPLLERRDELGPNQFETN
jgi:hypothetical protein